MLLGKAGRLPYAELTGVLVLPQVSYPFAYQQSCEGSSHHLMSNEGHLVRATFSPWHLELGVVMSGNNLYQYKITKRESELVQYLC